VPDPLAEQERCVGGGVGWWGGRREEGREDGRDERGEGGREGRITVFAEG